MGVNVLKIEDFEVCVGYYADDKVNSDDGYNTRKIIGEAYINLLGPDKIYCKEFISSESEYKLFWKSDGSVVSEKFGIMQYTKGVFSSDGELYNPNRVPLLVVSANMGTDDISDCSTYRKIPIQLKISDGTLEPIYKSISLTDYKKGIKNLLNVNYLNISLDAMEKLRTDYCSLELFDKYIVINNGLYIYDTSLCEFSGDIILPSNCRYFDVFYEYKSSNNVKSIVFPKGIEVCSKSVFDKLGYGDVVDLYLSKHTDRHIIENILDLKASDYYDLSESEFADYVNKVKENRFNFNFY